MEGVREGGRVMAMWHGEWCSRMCVICRVREVFPTPAVRVSGAFESREEHTSTIVCKVSGF